MIRAYSDFYLPDTRRNLGTLFHICVCQEGMDIDDTGTMFALSSIAKGIESGEPRMLAGMSGSEMASEVLGRRVVYNNPYLQLSPEYWTGYAMAQVQWYFNRPFGYIFDRYPCSRLLRAYYPLHEADLSKTCDVVGEVLIPENLIKARRRLLGYTQADLARIVGISLPALKAYESGRLDAGNASGYTVKRMADALGVTIDDILLTSGYPEKE